MTEAKGLPSERSSASDEDEAGLGGGGSEIVAVDGVPTDGVVVPRLKKQTIEDVLVFGEEPTEEFLTEFVALNEAPPVPDEELERQALSHPGEDGDLGTPE